MKKGHVPLVLAAQKLRVSRERAMRLMLIGVLDGEKRGGRWYIEAKSLERAIRQLVQTSEDSHAR